MTARQDTADGPPLPSPPPASSPAVRAIMQGNRRADTRPEVALRSALHRAGLRFRKHAVLWPETRVRADVVFRRERVAVFIDGCFWHRCPEHGVMPTTNRAYWEAKLERNTIRDRRNDALLRAVGWTVIRIWEHEDPEEASRRIASLIRAHRATPS